VSVCRDIGMRSFSCRVLLKVKSTGLGANTASPLEPTCERGLPERLTLTLYPGTTDISLSFPLRFPRYTAPRDVVEVARTSNDSAE
jgi:hypothetical protein